MGKIKMTTPLVEMDGDEMTRILWKMIKDELLIPYIDLKTEYYDLGLEHRNETDDQVTVDSARPPTRTAFATGDISPHITLAPSMAPWPFHASAFITATVYRRSA